MFYCVKCGVKLSEGLKACPLCGTPVVSLYTSAAEKAPRRYSDRYPEEDRHALLTLLGLATALMLAAALLCFLICIRTYRRVSWSGYVMGGLGLAWVLLILPLWFRKRNPLIFLPIDTAAICGYLLYICLYLRQHWFLSFGFPVTLLAGGMSTLAYVLLHFIKKGKLFVFGGLTVAAGAACVLVELFQHIAFGTEMFLWSLYCLGFFTVLGLFLILAAMIPSLASFLERRFFV